MDIENRTKEQKMFRSFNFSTPTRIAFSSLNSKQESLKAIMSRKNLYKLMRQFDQRQDFRLRLGNQTLVKLDGETRTHSLR